MLCCISKRIYFRQYSLCIDMSSGVKSKHAFLMMAKRTKHIVDIYITYTCIYLVHLLSKPQKYLCLCSVVTAPILNILDSIQHVLQATSIYGCPQSPLGVLKNCGAQTN
jgi:hypothetical protein